MRSKHTLYLLYLTADRMQKIADEAGVSVDVIHLNGYPKDVSFQCSDRTDRSNEGNEKAAIALMDAMPELALRRTSGLIYLESVTNLGVSFQLYCGSGVCERVQVGERLVPAVAAQPERMEPVFEIVCTDPLVAVQ